MHEEAFNRSSSINHPDLISTVCQAEHWPARLLSASLALLSRPPSSVFPPQLIWIAERKGESAPLLEPALHDKSSRVSAPRLQGCGEIIWAAKGRHSPKSHSLPTNTRDQNSHAFSKMPNFAYLIFKTSTESCQNYINCRKPVFISRHIKEYYLTFSCLPTLKQKSQIWKRCNCGLCDSWRQMYGDQRTQKCVFFWQLHQNHHHTTGLWQQFPQFLLVLGELVGSRILSSLKS